MDVSDFQPHRIWCKQLSILNVGTSSIDHCLSSALRPCIWYCTLMRVWLEGEAKNRSVTYIQYGNSWGNTNTVFFCLVCQQKFIGLPYVSTSHEAVPMSWMQTIVNIACTYFQYWPLFVFCLASPQNQPFLVTGGFLSISILASICLHHSILVHILLCYCE
jgi:hypothetical protein